MSAHPSPAAALQTAMFAVVTTVLCPTAVLRKGLAPSTTSSSVHGRAEVPNGVFFGCPCSSVGRDTCLCQVHLWPSSSVWLPCMCKTSAVRQVLHSRKAADTHTLPLEHRYQASSRLSSTSHTSNSIPCMLFPSARHTPGLIQLSPTHWSPPHRWAQAVNMWGVVLRKPPAAVGACSTPSPPAGCSHGAW
jgi:hypothetical protein